METVTLYTFVEDKSVVLVKIANKIDLSFRHLTLDTCYLLVLMTQVIETKAELS